MYVSESLLDPQLDFQHLIVWPGLSDHNFATQIQFFNKSHPAGSNELWRMNISYLRQPSLTRRIQQICNAYREGKKNGLWWDAFKAELIEAAKHHSHLESARVKGLMTALLNEVAALTSQIMENPLNEVLAHRLDKQHAQLNKYLERKLNFYKQCAMEKANPHTTNACKILSNLIKERKSKTYISRLSSSAEEFTTTNQILLHASNFYTQLYSHTSNGHPSHPIWDSPTSTLPPDILPLRTHCPIHRTRDKRGSTCPPLRKNTRHGRPT